MNDFANPSHPARTDSWPEIRTERSSRRPPESSQTLRILSRKADSTKGKPYSTDVPSKRACVQEIAVEHIEEFSPFRAEIECSQCHYNMAIMLQPVHMEIPIQCPSCGHNLTYVIRQSIRKHLQQVLTV